MHYQIFTRSRGKNPRRVCVIFGIEEARGYCSPRNAARTAAQIGCGFFYEFANLPRYVEAFGR